MLSGPFNILKRISGDPRDYPPVYEVSDPAGESRLALKLHPETPGSSASSDADQRDKLRHSLEIYRKVGPHDNINKVHGMAMATVENKQKEGLVMDMGNANLLDAMEIFGAAREEGKLSDDHYFGIVLPCIARAVTAGAAHFAKAKISHEDIDPANVLLMLDGRSPQLGDFGDARAHATPASAGWPDTEIAAGNLFAGIYPADRIHIAMTLNQLATTVDGNAALKLPAGSGSPAIDALRDLLARSKPGALGNRPSTAADFRFLHMGSDAQAGQIFAALLGGISA